ncbi:MAG: hypothetical protein ABSG57_13840 [Candidatus Bathyarchaeia archaeon]|jgi:hypothetical protein
MPRKRFTVAFLLVMFAVLLVAEPLPVHAASSLVQRNSTWCNTFHGYDVCNDAATLSVSFANGVTSGNLLVVAVTVGSNPPVTVISVSDSRGSSFTQAVSDSMTNNYAYAYIYYAILSSSGPDMVTATFSAVPYKDPNDPLGGTGIAYLHIFEVSGVSTVGITTGNDSGLLSGVGTISTSSTAFQSGAFLVAIATEDILTGNWAVGTGFTLSPNPSYDQYNDLSMTQYSTSGVASPTTFPATLSASGGNDKNWVEVGAAFQPGVVTFTTVVSTVNTGTLSTGNRFVTVTTAISYSTTSWTSAGTVTQLVTEFDTIYGYFVNVAAQAVGGFIEETNKLGILTTWFTILGCVAVAFVVVKPWKRRK